MEVRTGTTRVTTRTLLLLFVAVLAVVAAVFNLRDRIVQRPILTDGVIWTDNADGRIVADRVEEGSPAARAGVRPGDILVGINTNGQDPFDEVLHAYQVQIYLDTAKDLGRDQTRLSYLILRLNDAGDTRIAEGIADLDSLDEQQTHLGRDLYVALIGLIYLAIGVYVLLRQGRAPYVVHFFSICLLAFIVHAFSATDEMRTQFDKVIDLTDTIAFIFLPPLFIHFAAIYPSRYHLFSGKRWKSMLLYVPAMILLVAEVMFRFARVRAHLPWSHVGTRSLLEQTEVIAFAASLLISSALLLRTFHRARAVLDRQQLKWVVWGMGIAAIAFSVFYLPSFLLSGQASELMTLLAIAPFVFIPLTIGYSIVRYRLMDVDVVVRRSAAYIIATFSVAVLFGSVMAGSFEFLRQWLSSGGQVLIAAIAMSAIAMLFAPMKNWVQERIDRFFYGEKYDYRVTLQDFGRALSSTTELDVLLDRLVRRLREVLSVERLAVFVEDSKAPSGFRVARADGVGRKIELPADFLTMLRVESGSTGIVRADSFDSWDNAISESPDALKAGRVFSYYVPCAARSRVVAVIALGRGAGGSLLSSEDSELLRSISGYVAVAIENASLLQEQAHRARELERLKDFNENIIESISLGVMVISPKGRIVNWNGSLEAIYGVKREDVISRRLAQVVNADTLKTLRTMMDRKDWRADRPDGIYKFRTRAADGRELILNISIAPLQGKRGEVEGTLIAVEDITERVRLEEQLQQSDKLSSIGLLAAGVAHEVNTPLTGISSYAQMLMQQVPVTDPRRNLLEKIHRQTSRASAIVNNLLNFSRISDSRSAPVDLHRVLDDTIQLLEAQLRNTRIEVIRDYKDGLPPLAGNAPNLQQVFMNLMINARDAMPHGGELHISTTLNSDGSVNVNFRDTGVGISPEHVGKIYDPFFTTKRIGQGTGLGLAVSYGIIQEHGGRITVESTVGVGTTFHIAFPLVNPREHLANASD